MHRPEFWPVPVHRLMCKDVRLSSMLTENRPIHRREMKVFLSLLHEVVDRWYSAVAPLNPDIAALRGYHTELVHELESFFLSLMDNDTEGVFDERRSFAIAFDSVADMLVSFSSVFSGPTELIRFYSLILRRLEKTIHIIPEGEHGW